MKLQQRLNRKVGDKEYVKWYVDIPADVIKEAGWKEGSDLEVVVKDGKVVLRPKK
jgi:AbrB family looped-hinge helix DNA binding protein